MTFEKKLATAASVICRQGIFKLPVNETTLEVVKIVVGRAEEELDLIAAFRKTPSQTLSQLAESSEMDPTKAAVLADSLAGKGLIFNQPVSD